MFVLLETRGTDASGFAYLNNKNELQITKAETPASSLVKTDSWKNLQLPKMMIFHTRLKTQGEPSNNMNIKSV
jgi:glucosamine 6-phosphate synthetase-like amidotransferase/phosphosugar isomerase protein